MPKTAKVIVTDKPQSVVRRSIFAKYVLVLFAAVVVPLSINGASEAWFGYRDQRILLDARLRVEASAAASKIQSFLDANGRDDIPDQFQIDLGHGDSRGRSTACNRDRHVGFRTSV